jgi:replication factor C subunit 1
MKQQGILNFFKGKSSASKQTKVKQELKQSTLPLVKKSMDAMHSK